MKRPGAAAIAATLLLVAGLAWTTSCSNSSDNNYLTNPPPPPGGSLELNSGTINGGGTYVHAFANAGTYNYHCTIHGPIMSGSVHVLAGHPNTAAVTISNNAYTPVTALVAPGGTVTWTNNGSPHTVTSN